jgi:hypothetical protein
MKQQNTQPTDNKLEIRRKQAYDISVKSRECRIIRTDLSVTTDISADSRYSSY